MFTGTPELQDTLNQALKDKIKELGLMFVNSDNEIHGAYAECYGWKGQLGEELAWCIRLQVGEGKYGGLEFHAQSMAHYSDEIGWEWLQSLSHPDLPYGLCTSCTWVTSGYKDALDYNVRSTDIDPRFIPAIEYTVKRHHEWVLKDKAAKEKAKEIASLVKADDEGDFTFTNGKGRINVWSGEVSIHLDIKTDDPDKVAAIIEIMKGK